MSQLNNGIAAITKDLIESHPPAHFISFLFDAQNALISHNHLEGYTKEGSAHLATNFALLKDFFQDLQNLKS